MEYKMFIENIAYRISEFLNSRGVSAATPEIQINQDFKTYMSNNLNLNHKNYKLVPTKFLKKFKLCKYFRHKKNEGIVVLTSIEFKFVPEKVSKINKRIRTLETKSPLLLKVRLKKITLPRMSNDSIESFDNWERNRQK